MVTWALGHGRLRRPWRSTEAYRLTDQGAPISPVAMWASGQWHRTISSMLRGEMLTLPGGSVLTVPAYRVGTGFSLRALPAKPYITTVGHGLRPQLYTIMERTWASALRPRRHCWVLLAVMS